MFKKIKAIFLFVIFIALFASVGYLYYQFNTFKNSASLSRSNGGELSDNKQVINNQKSLDKFSFSECLDCVDEINKLIDEKTVTLPTGSITATPKAVTYDNTSFIPLGGPGSATGTDWVTIDSMSAYIDVPNDFHKDAWISWQASIKPAYGSGGVAVRLWDDTNKIAVNGSELSSSNNATYYTGKSGRIYLWNGSNLYKVQLKSTGGEEVIVGDAKIKVEY